MKYFVYNNIKSNLESLLSNKLASPAALRALNYIAYKCDTVLIF